MRATDWRESRRRAIHQRSRRCVMRWKMRSVYASKGNAARDSSIRRWCRHCSTACSLHGCYGRVGGDLMWARCSRVNLLPVSSNGALPSGTCGRPCSPPCFSNCRSPEGYSRSASSKCSTGRPLRSTGLTGRTFFSRFNEGEAVPYFYEPFLEAFDPQLRKQLGVWYTPSEVVRYMVARVDKALKDDLGIPEGLAAENVYLLDPCCGTGAYLAEVLRRIAANLDVQGLGALAGARVKQAATERVFGFEIMPAPFVIAHLQVGLTMQGLDATLAEDGTERAGVYLTNALTGWEPHTAKPLPFPELEEERDRAERVKQETPILVILGNPPYNGFAGMAVDEERELSEAYRITKRVRRPEGQGLNDLYVRFFRMAERRIAEKTGQGVVCFISNYSWLDGLSFTGMRERFLEAFDAIRIDCLNGDKYKTGKVAPDGTPDPSIFSTEGDPVGIQVGTAIATLVRKAEHTPTVRQSVSGIFGGQAKRSELLETAQAEPESVYGTFEPILPLGLPLMRTAVSGEWFDWPSLPDLFPAWYQGSETGRDAFLIDTDLDRLQARVTDYFDAGLSHEEIARRYPIVMKDTARFDAGAVRNALLRRGGPSETGFIRHAYRPFDNRWLYWEKGHEAAATRRARRLSGRACVRGESVAVGRTAFAKRCGRTAGVSHETAWDVGI